MPPLSLFVVAPVVCCYRLLTFESYAGYSKKGYAPYNPRKRNQDALVMAEDASTASVFLAVMDGHGEVGDKVAQVNICFLNMPEVLKHTYENVHMLQLYAG